MMFNIDRTKVEDEKFLAFANKHDIKKIVEPNNQVRWCVELCSVILLLQDDETFSQHDANFDP